MPATTDTDAHWHALGGDDALAAVGSRPDGLSTIEAEARHERFGPNRIAPMRPEPARLLLWRQLSSPLILVLIAAGVVALALGEVTDGAVVLAVVVANSAIGFIQEWRAGRAIQALAGLVPERATVVREGTRAELDAERVVPGDIVELRPGARVPADARLLNSRGLEVDESPLTGESLPVAKRDPPVPADAVVADRASMTHGGTLVTSGTATAVVVRTGERTELGRISELMRRTEGVETPLTRGLAGVARLLTVLICVVAAALLAVALARGYELVEAVLAAVSLAVAAIPEGLPAIVTIALAVGVQRMARRQAVTRRLPAVETLGSTTVICTDKTGTLTQNRMAVAEVWGDEPAVLRAAALCSDGTAPTEVALLDAAQRAGVDVDAPRLDTVPFDSERKFMATLHPGFMLIKGAPEVVLERCAPRAGAAEAVEAMASRGMRVLAVARRAVAGLSELRASDLDGGLELLGLAALVDPPRESALAAVGACRAAGVDVKMITGDHVSTASAIGARFGLSGRAFTGRELDALDEAEFERAAVEGTVFARVAPEHKLRLVRTLQRGGQVVAMTGDGVNDAPALKQADIGVAMGRSGTAAAREAADIVLTDDDFASIEAAVEEGRHVFDNVQKAIAFVLPTNLGEALIVLLAVLFFPFEAGVPQLPVEPTQILWVNLIATVTLALPLAVEALEPGVMARPPRPPGTPVIDRLLVMRTVVVTLLMTVSALTLFAVRDDQTLVVTTIVLFQVFYLLECRSLRHSILHVGLWTNPWALAGIAGVLALQAAFIYAPPLQDVFGSAPLGAEDWLLALAAAATVLPVVGAEKWWRRRGGRGHFTRAEVVSTPPPTARPVSARRHLAWLLGGMALAFLVPFVIADQLGLQRDLYLVVYSAAVLALFLAWARDTGRSVREMLARRWPLAVGLGFVFGALGAVIVTGAEDGSPHPGGIEFMGALLWRGIVYGAADGLLLSAFPILVVFAVFEKSRLRRHVGGLIVVGAIAMAASLAMTAVYHAGYSDFRGSKLSKPVTGDLVWSAPTLATLNPVGAPIAHVGVHVTAVVHDYETDLFLPPH